MKAKIWNKSWWIKEINPKQLKYIFNGFLLEAGFEILGFIEYYFLPFGYSCTWLISESHLAVHTFPEENKAYVELSSCNKEMYGYFNRKTQSYFKDKFKRI